MIYLSGTIAIMCLLGFVVSNVMLMNELRKRKVKVNFFLYRILIFKYLNQYKKLTVEETGKPGEVYYLFITCAIGMGVFGIITILIKKLG